MRNMISKQYFVRWGCALLVAFGGLGWQSAQAIVTTAGDVFPTDNPFTDGYEGIVNYIPNFVHGPDDDPDLPPPQPNFEHPLPIIVGQTSYGIVLINGGTQLRYQDLVLGGSIGPSNPGDPNLGFDEEISGPTTGHGIFRIEGFGTLFNNNPGIIPPGYEDVVDPTPRPGLGGGTPDDPDAPIDGYDVYVGLTGSGTLQVVDGGRMEIQDALVVGWAAGAVGEVLLDGFGAHIDQRGSSEISDSPSITAIGPLGTGILTIRNGAQMDSHSGAAVGTTDAEGGGALVIIDPDTGEVTPVPGTTQGGSGVATVDGLGSVWRIGGGLALGTWAENPIGYIGELGNGHLTVSNRGVVTLYEGGDSDANLVVGREGRITLVDGRVSAVGEVISDGVLEGHGRIDSGIFHNRRTGEMHVGLGETMIVTSTQEETPPEFYMANDGLIEVVGGTLDFRRNAIQEDPAARFLNRIVEGDEVLPPTQGKIVVQNGTVRFQSGLQNDGVLGLTYGNNVVRGDVFNGITGDILISGSSNATFTDDVINDGLLNLGGDGTLVSMTVLGDFVNGPSGLLKLVLGGTDSPGLLSGIAVAGDITLAGALEVSLAGLSPIDPQPGDEFTLLTGGGVTSGTFASLFLPELSDPTWGWTLFERFGDVVLSVSDVMAVGGDFNGDGIVDAADLAIWQNNFGLMSGATGLLGDANGDGAVNMLDYYIWLDQVGGPPMPAGALLGSIPPAGSAVPEPATWVLAATGLLAGWGVSRRRARR